MISADETLQENELSAQLAVELGKLIGGLPVGSHFFIPPAADLCYGLELFLPQVLRQQYPEWEKESLDGIFMARATKTGDATAELVGTCILISDQTVTPFLLELETEMRASGSAASVRRLCLGEPGIGPLGISGPACNTKEAQQLLTTLVDRLEAVPWKYRV